MRQASMPGRSHSNTREEWPSLTLVLSPTEGRGAASGELTPVSGFSCQLGVRSAVRDSSAGSDLMLKPCKLIAIRPASSHTLISKREWACPLTGPGIFFVLSGLRYAHAQPCVGTSPAIESSSNAKGTHVRDVGAHVADMGAHVADRGASGSWNIIGSICIPMQACIAASST